MVNGLQGEMENKWEVEADHQTYISPVGAPSPSDLRPIAA